MRCKACDRALSDQEATRKDGHDGYEEMCNTCLRQVMLPKFLGQTEDDVAEEQMEQEYYSDLPQR